MAETKTGTTTGDATSNRAKNKSQLVEALAAAVPGSTKKDAKAFLDAFVALAADDVVSTGEFVIPELVKLKVVTKAATAEKQGVNPFTKAPMTVKARPARSGLKFKALKALKDRVAALAV